MVMDIAVTTNILTIVLCLAVLVQSSRMMRSLRKVKDGALSDTVKALDIATVQARAVLSDMKRTLSGDCAENARLVAEARGLRDELSVMIGIADSTAERIAGAVSSARGEQREEADKPAKPAAARSKAKAEPKRRAPRKTKAQVGEDTALVSAIAAAVAAGMPAEAA
tara:strand:- start:163 stop:663 length:501 start_codon:yes stop_codon:yes gene_type:complete